MKEYILSNTEAKQVDQHTIHELGIPGIELMRKAGNFVSLKAKKILKDVPGSRIDIFCGTGNNGGDGFVAACDLWEWGADIRVWIIGDPVKISGDAKHFYQQCQQAEIRIQAIQKSEQLELIDRLPEADLIIDGLLGTGLRGEVRGLIRTIIETINQARRPVLAIDIPSGILGDTGQVGGLAVRAIKTVTMGFLKRGLLFSPGREYAGEVVLADLGYPARSYTVLETETSLIRKEEVHGMLPPIARDTYKHRRGKVLLCAGSAGMTGAAILAAQGASRSGAGLVVAAIPASLNPILETQLTEVLTLPVDESEQQTFSADSLVQVKERLEWCDVVALGPGLSDDPEALAFSIRLLRQSKNKRVIIDADGLHALPQNMELLEQLEEVVLTPHYGEFAQLAGTSIAAVRENPIEAARQFVRQHAVTLVLKGAPSIVVAKDLTTAVNSSGNPALASGGSGDVLTGMIAAFLAQGMPAYEAACSAVFLHGTAADLGRMDLGIRGFVASDLIEYLPRVLKEYDRLR